MDRHLKSGGSATPPSIPAGATNDYPIPGDPGVGTPASVPGPWWYHMVTEELRYLLTQNGITPDDSDLTQIHAAVAAQIASSTNVVPVGGLIPFTGIDVPAGYLKANGAAVSRATYANLFNATTVQDVGNTTTGSAVVTAIADTSKMVAGWPISGPGIPASTTILSVDSGTQITLSQKATATASAVAIVVAPHGVGDGATTFNVIETRGEFLRGFDDGRGIDAGRLLFGWQADELKSHTHSATTGTGGSFLYGNSVGGTSQPSGTSGATGGSETRPRNIAVPFLVKY